MWPFRREDILTFEVENTFGPGTNVRGDLRGPSGFRIDGTVEGGVEAGGGVIVGEGGTIDGSVRGKNVVVLGRVRGDIVSEGHLEIGPKASVIGDVTVKSLRVHDGGVFLGTTRVGAHDATTTTPLGVLSPAELEKAKRGRTLPPPLGGAVPPPPPPAVPPALPAAATGRPATRDSGEVPRKAAAND